MTRNMMILILIGGVLIAVTLIWNSYSHPKPITTQPETPVSTDVVQITPDVIQKIGIEIIPIQTRVDSTPLITNGEVKADENQIFQVDALVSGRVVQENGLLGERVSTGQTLARIQSPEIAKISGDYQHQLNQNEVDIQQARDRLSLDRENLERERQLFQQDISPKKDYLQAQSNARIAQSTLNGLKTREIQLHQEANSVLGAYGVRHSGFTAKRIQSTSPVTAPHNGLITKKNVTIGDMVAADQLLYEVTDLRRIWLDVTVYPKDLPLVKVGQTIHFSSDSLPGKIFTGEINYIQPSADPVTQTFVARAFLQNTDMLLRPGMFGQGSIQKPQQESKPFVPDAAMQTFGKETFVFVPVRNGQYRKRTIHVAKKLPDGVLIDQGLQIGESIVGKGSFSLKSILYKDQFNHEEE